MTTLPSRLPLIQAPMVGSSSPLAIAVCEAGGLGSLACAALGPQQLRDEIAAIRARTPAPFNVNFFCHTPPAPDAEVDARWRAALAGYYAEAGLDPADVKGGPGRAPFDDAMCAVVEALRPAVVSFHFGLPDDALLERVRRTGAWVVSSATTVEEARWLDARGVDAIVAQGAEAGGHRGMFLTDDIHAQPGLFALLPQIVDAVRVPVIAAGAIADGRGIAAAFALGARGADRHGLLADAASRPLGAASRGGARRARRRHAHDQPVHGPTRARAADALHARAGADERARAGVPVGDGRGRSAA